MNSAICSTSWSESQPNALGDNTSVPNPVLALKVAAAVRITATVGRAIAACSTTESHCLHGVVPTLFSQTQIRLQASASLSTMSCAAAEGNPCTLMTSSKSSVCLLTYLCSAPPPPANCSLIHFLHPLTLASKCSFLLLSSSAKTHLDVASNRSTASHGRVVVESNCATNSCHLSPCERVERIGLRTEESLRVSASHCCCCPLLSPLPTSPPAPPASAALFAAIFARTAISSILRLAHKNL